MEPIIKFNNISPLRYPGGKTRACKKLDEIFNQYFDVNQFNKVISPFFGGGSFEFHLQNKYSLGILANDKFKPLYYFWKICKTKKQELIDELESIDAVNKEKFLEYRSKIIDEKNKVKKAFYYFVINRCSFSGATLSGGFSEEASTKRFTQNSIDKIKELNLTKFKISNYDFEDFINNNYPKNNAFMFLDPPYYLEKGSKLYGNKGDMHESFNHEKLHQVLSNKKNWMMTYNDCTYIRELYHDYIILDVDWSYGMNKSKESSEIVIIKLDD
jgi:DNA adenine methylase